MNEEREEEEKDNESVWDNVIMYVQQILSQDCSVTQFDTYIVSH